MIADPPGSTAVAADDTAVLASGGRTSFGGFLLRLLARMPFLFIAGRLYGSAEVGRFGYAILVVELTAQLATLGLKRGLAEELAQEKGPHASTVADALLLGAVLAAVGAALLMALPALVFPAGEVSALDHFFPLIALAVAASDISLAGLAFRHDIAAQVRARSIIEPWTLTLMAVPAWYLIGKSDGLLVAYAASMLAAVAASDISLAGLAFRHDIAAQVRARSIIEPWTLTLVAVPAYYLIGKSDGLLVAYAASMLAAVAASLIPCIRAFGWPHHWRPSFSRLIALARANAPLAGADVADWGSRRLDFFLLGRFASAEVTGIYFVAQNIASLAAKLKNSFDPILAPLLTTSLARGDTEAVAGHVRQVAFWILAAQFAVVLALGLTAQASMGLFGPAFAKGAAVLAVLLTVELLASQGAVAEAALIYVRRRTNLAIAVAGLVVQAGVTLVFVQRYGALAAAGGLAVSVLLVSMAKSWLLRRELGSRVSGWRIALFVAAVPAFGVGVGVQHLPEWAQLSVGLVAILGTFGGLVWWLGFGPSDRLLFQRRRAD